MCVSNIDRFADTAAILISVVSKGIMGCSGGKVNMHFAPEHPIIAIEAIETKMATVSAKRSMSRALRVPRVTGVFRSDSYIISRNQGLLVVYL